MRHSTRRTDLPTNRLNNSEGWSNTGMLKLLRAPTFPANPEVELWKVELTPGPEALDSAPAKSMFDKLLRGLILPMLPLPSSERLNDPNGIRMLPSPMPSRLLIRVITLATS